MAPKTPTGDLFKGVFLWLMLMMPTLITLVTRDFVINMVLLTVAFPIMLAFLVNMKDSPIMMKTSVVGVSSAITFFVLYILSRFFPRIQEGIKDPGKNRSTTIYVILLIAGFYGLSMTLTGYFLLPMYEYDVSSGAVINSGYGSGAPTAPPSY